MADVGLTKEQVISICGELATAVITTDEWNTQIELTQLEINPGPNAFNGEVRANVAARWLCAHKMLKYLASKKVGSGVGGPAGPLSSVTVGQISKTFRTPGNVDAASSAEADLQSTAPGREYLRLCRLWCGRVFAV